MIFWRWLGKLFVATFGRALADIIADWRRDRANVALGQATARADRLAAEAALNKEMQDAEDRARFDPDAALRERLRRTLGRPFDPVI